MKLIDGDNLIEHAEANGESFEFIRKLIDYISDEPEIKASISQGHEDDLISRKAAIDAIGKYLKKDGDQIVIADVVDAAVAIAQLPSVQPERKKSKWMKAYADIDVMGIRPFMRYCSECKEVTVQAYNYCPNCGAEMER